MSKERNTRRNPTRYMRDKAPSISKDTNKINVSKTDTPPHSKRRRNRKNSHHFKTAHAYSVENELQPKNNLPVMNLVQGLVIDSGALIINL